MSFNGRLIERYLLAAVVPYLLLALLLLTTILFAQQSSRFAELLLIVHIRGEIAAQVALALVPNVLVFTLPMATLAGILIGLSRMGGDSELIAMRAAGIGTWRLLQPVLLIGLSVSAAAAYINLELAPQSTRSLRQTLTLTAISKLDSPVDPGDFNTEIPNYLIYVRDGDKESGRWGRVFIYSHDDKTKAQRIVTARSGRIDSAAGQSELVLTDAVAIEIPAANAFNGSYVSTHLQQLRLQLDTGRKALLEKLSGGKPLPDEMKWSELERDAAHKSGKEARDAVTLQQKRAALSLTPLVFALLGASLGLRVKKGGRGAGVLISLAALIAYYLLALLGEQLSRAGTLPPQLGMWIATTLTVAFSLLLLLTGRYRGRSGVLKMLPGLTRGGSAMEHGPRKTAARAGLSQSVGRARLLSFPSLLDISLLRALTMSFGFALASLSAVFLIFTLFELWRAIIENSAGFGLVARYLLFLLPFVTVQIMPASVLLAMLVAYALLTRRSEAIAWWASGQSIYRLMLPGMLFAVFVAACSWMLQENLMPQANRRQDELRARIKRPSAPRTTTPVGRQWLASSAESEGGRLYAYEFDDESNSLAAPAIYEFDNEGVHLKSIVQGSRGVWTGNETHRLEISDGSLLELNGGNIRRSSPRSLTLSAADEMETFKPTLKDPAHLSAWELRDYIKRARRRGDSARIMTAALQAKYAAPFGSLVLALVAIPLALSFGKRSAVTALCAAIALAMAFWAASGGFHQLGTYGLLPITIAAWSPAAIFAALGGYLLTRVRT
ncbi:MAG: LptF/LptG family permease [Pyrinomonadaceae bacterium]